jgi:hypothetical protein
MSQLTDPDTWRSAQLRDPLADSDGEDADETVRKDYGKYTWAFYKLILITLL